MSFIAGIALALMTEQGESAPSISSFIFSCLSATIGCSRAMDFLAVASSGLSSSAYIRGKELEKSKIE